ncbi:HTTM domain-containing protein [soil metagenome]
MTTATARPLATRRGSRPRAWLFPAVPRARAAVMRKVVYTFVFIDVLVTTSWVPMHGYTPGALYQPLFIGRLLDLPTPGLVFVRGIQGAVLVAAAIALTGRWPRAAGAATFFLYLQWMLIAFSYGKVNHDRVAFLVALAVLPTVGAASRDDRTLDEGAGWALRCIQVAVVLTYLLAAFAKLRYGGIDWVNGATLLRGVLRRGTSLADPLIDHPWILHWSQYALVSFELTSPLLLARGLVGRVYLWAAGAFHLVTWAALKISFLPHVVCLLAFLPLEDLRLQSLRRAERSRWTISGDAGRPVGR